MHWQCFNRVTSTFLDRCNSTGSSPTSWSCTEYHTQHKYTNYSAYFNWTTHTQSNIYYIAHHLYSYRAPSDVSHLLWKHTGDWGSMEGQASAELCKLFHPTVIHSRPVRGTLSTLPHSCVCGWILTSEHLCVCNPLCHCCRYTDCFHSVPRLHDFWQVRHQTSWYCWGRGWVKQ